MPYLFLCVVVLVIWLHYENYKTNKKIKKTLTSFWSKEKTANETRKTDISNLDYIVIPLEQLPLSETEDVTLRSYHEMIKNLSQLKILNLTGITNTELKLQYGVSNLKLLMEYDQNYMNLVQTLNRWGSYLYEHNDMYAARAVLEFGVSCRTDISNNYIVLANIYKELNDSYSFSQLIEKADQVSPYLKSSTISKLYEIKNS
jgi:hypothetical protein